MRRPRCLSCQERLWVDNAIGQLCIQHGVSDRDEDYRSTGWTAFLAAYRNFRPISSPAFWPYAYGQISAALVAEKRIRQDRVYKLLSLDAPIAADSDECLLQRLPARQGDFTNSVLFWDYIRRLPRRLFQLAWRLVNRDSLEEARSAMGLTEQELCLAVGQLRDALTRYFIMKTNYPVTPRQKRSRCRNNRGIIDSPTPLFTPFCRFRYRSRGQIHSHQYPRTSSTNDPFLKWFSYASRMMRIAMSTSPF